MRSSSSPPAAVATSLKPTNGRLPLGRVVVVVVVLCLFAAMQLSTNSHLIRLFPTAGGGGRTVSSSAAAAGSRTAPTSGHPTDYRGALRIGIRSHQQQSFFRRLQADVDAADPVERCARYGGTPSSHNSSSSSKRIFYGALIATEPWELLEIVAAEAYGIYSGIILVEGNRTQNGTPRPFRLDPPSMSVEIATLFGIADPSAVQIRRFVDEADFVGTNGVNHNEGKGENHFLDREHRQRDEVLRGWQELGMQRNDIGFLADLDETLTRDFFRAIQTCQGVAPALDDDDDDNAEHHACRHDRVKVMVKTRIFEGSPECVTQDREGWHPEVMLGQCIEGIADATRHPPAPRAPGTVFRGLGFGATCNDWDGEASIPDRRYPSWNACDFRRTCGGTQVSLLPTASSAMSTMDTAAAQLRREQQQLQFQSSTSSNLTASSPPLAAERYDRFTAFHFHNFFAELNSTRFKYGTYGHALRNAGTLPIQDLAMDLQLMVSCVKNEPDVPNAAFRRVPGGLANTSLFWPIYFYDSDYRQRRQDYVRQMVEADEHYMAILAAGGTDPANSINATGDPARKRR